MLGAACVSRWQERHKAKGGWNRDQQSLALTWQSLQHTTALSVLVLSALATWDHPACARGMLQSTEKLVLDLNTAIVVWKWTFPSWSLHTFLVMGKVWGKLFLSQFLKNLEILIFHRLSMFHRITEWFPLDHISQSFIQLGLEHFQGMGKDVFSSHICSFREFRTILHFTGYSICFTFAKLHLTPIPLVEL